MNVDLRSDTVTRPTPAMLEAMLAAEVGDDIYDEDPSVKELESKVAKLLGKEAALFVPSGTMANQLAIACHTRPGDGVIAEAESHCFLYEAGAASALSGVQFDFIPWEAGYSDQAIGEAYKPEWMHYASTSLLVVENTHNRAAGRTFDASTMNRIAVKARELEIKTHCDGARIWNAAHATGSSEKELLAGFDSVACCFSKGLGAPVGSALAGTNTVIQRAKKLRKRWGGAMRQSGYLAKAASYALDHHRDRLKEDHEHIAMLAGALDELKKSGVPIEVKYPNPGTNLIYFRKGSDKGDEQAKQLADQGVHMHHLGQGWLRAVSHLQVSREQMAYAVETIVKALR